MGVKLSTKGIVTPTLADRLALVDDVGGADNVRLAEGQAARDLFSQAAINTQTGTAYTLALTDQGDIVEMNNGSANTLTIPTNAAVAFPVGTRIRVTQFGAGPTTVQGDTGVSVNGTSAGSEAIGGQFQHLDLYQRAADDWLAQSGGGGGGTPGGSDTQVQYNDGGAFGGDAGMTYDDVNKALTVGGATVTTSQPVLDLSQTWNDGGVTFTGIKANFTDTASASGSLPMALQVGGSTVFQVEKEGHVEVSGNYYTQTGGDLVSVGGAFVVTASSRLNPRLNMDISRLKLANPYELHFSSSTSSIDSNIDTLLTRSAAGTFSQRSHTAAANTAQNYLLHAAYGGATDYHRSAWSTAKVTLSAVSGASVTASSLIPDGAVVVGVTTKVTTALGTGNGTTGYQVGDGTDVDRWGEATTVTLGTVTQNSDWTSGTIECFTAAQDVVITAVGGNFDGTGAIEVTVHYLRGEAD